MIIRIPPPKPVIIPYIIKPIIGGIGNRFEICPKDTHKVPSITVGLKFNCYTMLLPMHWPIVLLR